MFAIKKYNISHIQLLRMIKKGKIIIECSDFVEPLIFLRGTLNFLNCYDELEPLTFKGFIENIKYARFRIRK